MEDSILNKIKTFFLSHHFIITIVSFLIITIILSSIFYTSYSIRNDIENNRFDEIQEYLEELNIKDKKIYNTTHTKKLKQTGKGIDISSWQGDINWEKVSKSNIDFVMIRCGFRNQSNEELNIDSKFIYNITQANLYNIPAGIYFYSTAINQKEALEEASFVLNIIKDYKITYPIAYDFETFNKKRTKGISSDTINENAKIFLDYISNHGYNGMLYTNHTTLTKHWDLSNFKNYDLWIAQYAEEPSFGGDISMWQYTDSGRVDGIKGRVDLDETYFIYKEIQTFK